MAFFANAAVLKLGSTTISELTSISAPNLTADTIDVTTHGSTGRYREFIQGLRDGGEISVEGFYTTASANTITTQLNTSATTTATIDLPTTPTATRFTATVICTAFSSEAPVDGAIGFSATFKVTGQPSIGIL